MKLLSTIIVSAVAVSTLSASPASLTSDSAGKCVLSTGGNSFQALNIEVPKTNNLVGNYSASLTPLTSLLGKSDSFSTQIFGEQAYLFGQMSKTETSASVANSIQQAVYAIADPTFKADATAESYVQQATQCYKTADLSNLVIATLTDDKGADCGKVIIQPTQPTPTPSSSQPAATPEPSTFMLLGGGLIAAGTFARRKKSVATN